jgi:2-polyprenyl-6-methoxyphenol hydroxylase-like FAD-dependent oxidoreductase
MSAMETSVLISGGGVAGLTLALKLVTQGIDVVMVEKQASETIMYKGELLQPKSIQILDQLGVLEPILENSWKIPRTIIFEKTQGHPNATKRISLEYGILPGAYPYALMIPHDQLKKILLQKALVTGRLTLLQPAHIIQTDSKNQEVRISHQGIEHTYRAKYIAIAEGKFSSMRAELGFRVKKQSYNHQFLTVTVGRPADLVDATVISCGARFVGLFPLPNEQVRTVMLIRGDEFKTIRKGGLAYFQQLFSELIPEMKPYLAELTEWKQIQLMIPLRQEALSYVKDNCVLLGDAAHSVHPMAGEGMNMAIQDADVLASALVYVLQNKCSDSILKRYESVRKPRARFVSAVSHLSALAYSYPHQISQPLRTHVIAQIAQQPDLMLQYMANVSGLGYSKESWIDRVRQLGMWPFSRIPSMFAPQMIWFSEESDYPWQYE